MNVLSTSVPCWVCMFYIHPYARLNEQLSCQPVFLAGYGYVLYTPLGQTKGTPVLSTCVPCWLWVCSVYIYIYIYIYTPRPDQMNKTEQNCPVMLGRVVQGPVMTSWIFQGPSSSLNMEMRWFHQTCFS